MLISSIRFVSLLLTSLLVGAMFGIWLGFNPSALTAMAYVEMQQNAIRALNISFPVLGLVCVLLTAALAALTKNDKRRPLPARGGGHMPCNSWRGDALWQSTNQCVWS